MTATSEPALLLVLPALRDGSLWRTARRLDAPLLISANALSRWRTDVIGLRFRSPILERLWGTSARSAQ